MLQTTDTHTLTAIVAFVAGPVALLLAALWYRLRPPARGSAGLRAAEVAALVAVGGAIVASVVVAGQGAITASLLGFAGGYGLAVHLDVVTLTMALLVSFVGWIVIRFARTQLDGEARQAWFLGWLALALVSVLALVSAATVVQLVLGWMGAGVAVRNLLLTYDTRAGAQRAARKKAIVGTGANVALIAACVMMVALSGTAEIAGIKAAAGAGLCWSVAAFLLATAASALIGSIVMLTQPAVKTALAWSTIAQMGFMILQCGLGLFGLALLHIVAHSLYKAHAFLSSGGAVGAVASIPRPGPVAVPGRKAVIRAFALSLLIYAVVALAFGLAGKPAQALALGAVLVLGVAYMLAQGLADAAPRALTRRMALASGVTTLAYFSLQMITLWLTAGTLPVIPAPGALEWFLIVLTVVSFGAVAVAQTCFPLWVHHPAAEGLRVHAANGFYLAAVVDRLTHGLFPKNTAKGA
jgi:NAD(P)H-quinone oxidoreductase subunit 5